MRANPSDRPEAEPPLEDGAFLALLVHHGFLDERAARAVAARAATGEPLEGLLCAALDLEPEALARLRRTRCGERPEIPGHRLERLLGRGATADVWAAVELASRRPLALKVLRPAVARDPRRLRAFVAEAKLLARLRHEGLVGCFGAARAGDTYLMRLELIRGRTLLERIDAGERFDEERALGVVLDVARTLAHLAGEGVVHRDVKPGNVMLTDGGRAVLIDLGLAAVLDGVAETRAADPGDGDPGDGDPGDGDPGGGDRVDGDRVEGAAPGPHAAGTRAYLSPEEALGEATVDPRSDIYSLGVSLFQLLFGRLPFEADDEEQLARAIFAELDQPELRGRAVSPHAQYFIEKMMAKDRDDRYQSWGELIADVEQQLAGRQALGRAGQPRVPRPRSTRRRRPR